MPRSKDRDNLNGEVAQSPWSTSSPLQLDSVDQSLVGELKASGRSIRYSLGVLLLICLIPAILMAAGVSLSTQPDVGVSDIVGADGSKIDVIHHVVRGSFTHTLLEWTGVCTAAFLVALVFLQYRLTREPSLVVIGVAMACAGAMDAFHTLAADRLIAGNAPNEMLIPFTWAACRLYNSVILLLGVGIFTIGPRASAEHTGTRFRLSGVLIGVTIAVMIVLAYLTVRFSAASGNLPQTMFPNALITRPFDLAPLGPFLLCGLVVYPMYYIRHRTYFAVGLMASAVPAVASQVYMAFWSSGLHDSAFNIAHGLKTVSYLAPTVGLLYEYARSLQNHRALGQRLMDEVHATQKALELTSLQHLALDRAAIVAVTNSRGVITHANDKFCDISGYSREELIGQSHRIVNSGHHPKSFFKEMWKTIASGHVWHSDMCNRAKDGSLYWVDTTIVPFKDDSGRVTEHVAIRSDITMQKQAENRIEASRLEAEGALQELSYQKNALDKAAIVAVTDSRGIIIEVNDKFCEISGYSREELIGQTHRIVNSGSHPKSFFVDMWKTIASGQVWHAEVCNRANGGALYWVDTTIVPFENDEGVITKYVAIRSDITEAKKSIEEIARFADDLTESKDMNEEKSIELANQSEQLEIAKREAEAASKSKSEFLANMSHEIRTPMTAILGFADLIEEEDISLEVRSDHIRTIRRNGEHLLTLINDILDLSKVEAGQMEFEQINCSPQEILGEIQTLMKPRADGKGISLEVEFAGPMPEVIQSDPTRVRQILVNLVGNALKFTECGGVTVTARFEQNDEAIMYFEVKDTGAGMTEAQTAKLFQPFMQADASTTRKFGGTGLGLAISRRLAIMLGGGIDIRSQVGEGSVFTASINCGDVSHAQVVINDEVDGVDEDQVSTKKDTPAESWDAAGQIEARILLVEDGPDNQRLISFHLRKAGADVEVAENGRIGVDKIMAALESSSPFDIIIMDMQMPVLDGYAATRELRTRGYTGPVVALTAHAMAGDREKCLDAGCNDFATKPIDRAGLIRTVRKNLSTDQRREEAA